MFKLNQQNLISPAIFWALVFVGLLIGHLYAISMQVDPDVGQLLIKARALVEKGELIHYGNRSSGMGSVMGPMTSLVAGVPMLIYNDIISPLIFIEALHFLALLMLLDVVARQVGPRAVPWVLILFWLNPWRASEVFLWNPAYLVFTSSLHLWTASRLSESKSFVYSFLHALAIVISMQLHNSFLVLVFLSAMLIYWRQLKLNWWGGGLAVALGLASLVPFFLLAIDNPDLLVGNKNPKAFLFRGLVYVFPTVKGITYWLRFNSGFFPKDVFKGVEIAKWLGEGSLSLVMQVIWDIFKYVFAVGSVLIVAKINFQFFRPRLQQLKIWIRNHREKEDVLEGYAMAGFASLLLVSMLSPIDFNYWHLVILIPASQIPLLLYLERSEPWRLSPSAVYYGLAFYCVVANLLMVAGSKKHLLSF